MGSSLVHFFMISGMDLKMRKKRSDLGLGSALFGISDAGLVKKCSLKLFFHKKLTGGPGDEISYVPVPEHLIREMFSNSGIFSRVSRKCPDRRKL